MDRGKLRGWLAKIEGSRTHFLIVECNMRQVIVYRDEDGYWVVECPSLKGCISQGKTKEEALRNIREAISGYVAALEEDGLPVPEDTFETFLAVV
jgi:predicted RNase H-like HicB family nuclease